MFLFRCCVWIAMIFDSFYYMAPLVLCELLNTDFQFGGICSESNAWYFSNSLSNQHRS
jgi:hypothetical protein